MKKIILLASLLAFTLLSNGQILKKIADRTKQKATSKSNENIDPNPGKATDPVSNKTDSGIKDGEKANGNIKTADTVIAPGKTASTDNSAT